MKITALSNHKPGILNNYIRIYILLVLFCLSVLISIQFSAHNLFMDIMPVLVMFLLIGALLMLFCLLDLSWSTFVLHSYFAGVILSPRFKLEYFCVTFVLYWCCFVSSI